MAQIWIVLGLQQLYNNLKKWFDINVTLQTDQKGNNVGLGRMAKKA